MARSQLTTAKALWIVGGILLVKLLIMVLLPITGDEAYFVKWGRHLASGYYDHPPMVGWLIYLMHFLSDNIVLYRMFSFVTTLILAYLIYLFAKRETSHTQAQWVALLFLASPVDLLMVLFTNDVPLVLFGTIGAYLFYRACEHQKPFWYSVGAGIFLGLAFLSKYFTALLVFSLLLYVLFMHRWQAWRIVLPAALAMLPFVAQNLYYNYQHCWNNIMFNFLTRPKTAYHPQMLLGLFGIILYLVTPWGLWYLRQANFSKGKLHFFIISVLGVAFGILVLVSLKNKIGLHWLLLFIPYVFLLFCYLSEKNLIKLFHYNLLFTLLHSVIILAILLLPLSFFQKSRSYGAIVAAVSPQEVCQHLSSYDDGRLFTLGYTSASMLSYSCKRDIHMLFNTSKYGRLDDRLVDIKALNGKDIVLFRERKIDPQILQQVCNRVTLLHFKVKGALFYLATCHNFSYTRYRKYFLNKINRKFYNIPSWLPYKSCDFKKKYDYKKDDENNRSIEPLSALVR